MAEREKKSEGKRRTKQVATAPAKSREAAKSRFRDRKPTTALGQRSNELNINNLCLISLQERIPPDFNKWQLDFEVGDQRGSLTCTANSLHGGVPHGIDNDFVNAIFEIFIEQGMPLDGLVVTTTNHVLRTAGFESNGHYSKQLRESLKRVQATIYSTQNIWRDHAVDLWTSVDFQIISDLNIAGRSGFDEGTISFRLAPAIVKSIRSAYLNKVDPRVLSLLKRPLPRAMYRLLEARRTDPEDITRKVDTYTVKLVEWGLICKLHDLRPSRLTRLLANVHNDLIEINYLRAVNYEGKGAEQTLTYVFSGTEATLSQAQLSTLAMLTKHRVTRPAAIKLITTYGVDRVVARVKRFEEILASGFKPQSPPAMLTDIIKDDLGKYGGEPTPTTKKPQSSPAARPLRQKEAAPDASQHPAEHPIEIAMTTLRFLLRQDLRVSDFERLKLLMERGLLNPEKVTREATAAKAKGNLFGFAEQLRMHLDAPPALLLEA